MSMMHLVIMAIVATIFATITLASLSYAVFRMRDRRRPSDYHFTDATPRFFERVRFPAHERVGSE